MDKLTLQAVGTVLKDERVITDRLIADTRKALEKQAKKSRRDLNEQLGGLLERLTVAASAGEMDLERIDLELGEIRSEVEKAASDSAAETEEFLLKVTKRLGKVREEVRISSEKAADKDEVERIDEEIDNLRNQMAKVSDKYAKAHEAALTGLTESIDGVRTEIQLVSELSVQELDDTYKTILKDIESIESKWKQGREDDKQEIITAVRSQVSDGEPGVDGKDGVDGLDSILVEPRFPQKGQQFERNEVVFWDGGLWQAIKKTVGTPAEDPTSYRTILNGLTSAEGKVDFATREYVIDCRFTDGSEDTIRFPDSARLLRPDDNHKSIEGDFYLDKSILNIFHGTEWVTYDLNGEQGKPGKDGNRGRKGMPGKDGLGIEEIYVRGREITVLFTDGTTKEMLIDIADPPVEKIDQEIKRYFGRYMFDHSYAAGDVVTAPSGLYVALKKTKAKLADTRAWGLMLAPGGGLGSGGGGGGGGWPPIVVSALDMQSFGIHNLRDPRTGVAAGLRDAVNLDSMQKAIAAGSLYQGTYKPIAESPSLRTAANSAFTAPKAGSRINKPTGAVALKTATDLDVWFDISNSGLNAFPATLAIPIKFEVILSDGTIHSVLIPAATYADVAALQAVIDAGLVGAEILRSTFMIANSMAYLEVETKPPLYAIALTEQKSSPFAAAVVGAKPTVLNTYNWVVSTKDPNVPEPAMPGIPGVEAGTMLHNSDILQWSDAKHIFEILRGGNLTQAFADNRYWQVLGGNMHWKDVIYQQGAVVLHENVWWQSTQLITIGTGEPGTTAAGAAWRKINSAYGSTVFFGRGDYDTTDSSAANNWGMPAGTFPGGQQPADGDVYFDVLTGSTTDFDVQNNPPTFSVHGTVDPAVSINLGDAFLGVAWTKENANAWTIDGVAKGLAKNSYYKIHTDATGYITTQRGAPDWNGPGDIHELIPHSEGDYIHVAAGLTVPIAKLGAAYQAFGAGALTGPGAFIHCGLEGYTGATSQGYAVVNGIAWVPEPPLVDFETTFGFSPQPAVTFFTVAAGLLKGMKIPVGDALIVWTGDPDAEHNGWVIIPDTDPRDWTAVTATSHTTPDTVTGVVNWGFQRDFQVTIPKGLVKGHWLQILKNISNTQDAVYRVEIVETTPGKSGESIEFETAISTTSQAIVSPIIVNASEPIFDRCCMDHVSATVQHGVFVRLIKTLTEDHTFSVSVVTTTGDLEHITLDVVDLGIAPTGGYSDVPDNTSRSFDVNRNYPSAELVDFLKARSGDSSAAIPGHAVATPGDTLTGTAISLEGGKLYKMSGTQLDVISQLIYVTVYKNGDINDKLEGSNAKTKVAGMADYSANKLVTFPLEPAGNGWFSLWQAGYGSKTGEITVLDVSVDFRNPKYITLRYHAMGLSSGGHTITSEVAVTWELDPTDDPAGYGFYFIGSTGSHAIISLFNDI